MSWSDIKFDFQAARVLVTGGTSGIGHAIASAFADAGAQVTVTGTRAGPEAYEEVDLTRFGYLRMDLEDAHSVDAVAEALPALDVLVNNAGLSFYPQGLDEHDPEVFERALKVHLSAPFRLTRRLSGKLAQSKRPGGGAVIGIGSVTSFMGISVTLGYGAGKTGLLGMTRGLAVDLGESGVRVNVVAAGMTRSRMTAAVFDDPTAQWAAPAIARTPLGRLGETDDIAGPVLFLASSAAGWVTGSVVMVDGGYTIMG